ncbi:MAG: thioesterase family protein [Dehalococcoidia bacterium]|nr:thioesterase family protein [Dehalococcoidia bacterium]
MQGTTPELDTLLQQLDLERLDTDLFLGNPGEGKGRLFGGMVLAQTVMAAYQTVEDRSVHSLHSYFVRPGRHEAPIRFLVNRIRDADHPGDERVAPTRAARPSSRRA